MMSQVTSHVDYMQGLLKQSQKREWMVTEWHGVVPHHRASMNTIPLSLWHGDNGLLLARGDAIRYGYPDVMGKHLKRRGHVVLIDSDYSTEKELWAAQ